MVSISSNLQTQSNIKKIYIYFVTLYVTGKYLILILFVWFS